MLRQPVQLARQRAPERNIPIDLKKIFVRDAYQRDVSKRFDSVLELNQAIQRHLESRAEPLIGRIILSCGPRKPGRTVHADR